MIAGVLFYLRSAGQSGSTLGAELIYGDANTVQKISLDKDAVYDIDTGYLTVHIEVKDARHGSLIPPALTTSAKALAGSHRRIRRPPACRHGPFLPSCPLPEDMSKRRIPMFDETSRSHTDDDSTRHIHRGHRPPEEKTVEVDSAAFFAPETAAPTPPPAPPKPPKHTGGPAPESNAPPPAGRMQIPARPTRNEVLFC